MLNLQSRITREKEKVQNLSLRGWGNLIAISKSWSNKNAIPYNDRNSTVVFEQWKNAEK